MTAHGHTVESLTAFEKKVADRFNRGEIRAPIHLSGGNELQLLRVFEDVGPDDYIFTTWRSHFHVLLKGVPPDRVMADILLGKSITLTYPDYRVVSSAIVGGILPIALGAALEIKRAGRPERVWAFIGDMTATTGIAHECMKYAVAWDLPIEFVQELNGKSVTTSTAAVWNDYEHRDIRPVAHTQTYEYDLPWPHSGAGRRVEF
jgi:TPP-dependent pyruvate/acetoin dehydrogenase alpha subunit